MSALLDVQNLVKLFPLGGSRKVVQAVNGVDFTINRGETLALVGAIRLGQDHNRPCRRRSDRGHCRRNLV